MKDADVFSIRTGLPSLREVPLGHDSGWRDYEVMMRMAMIPYDDPKVRQAATRLFVAQESYVQTVNPDEDAYKQQLLDLSNSSARTPGGVAWKLATVLAAIEPDNGEWQWWHYLMQSALVDALEQERARQDILTAPQRISA